MKVKVFVKNNRRLGIGVVCGSTWVKEECTEVRVYFPNREEIKSYTPKEVGYIEDDDN